jgi:hypothetical protein
MQPVPYGALTDIWRHRASFSRLGDLAPEVSTPLVLCNLLIRLVAFFYIVEKSVSSYCVKLEVTSRGNA